MKTVSALQDLCAGNSPVTGESHLQKPVARSFDVFIDPRLNQHLSKQLGIWDVVALIMTPFCKRYFQMQVYQWNLWISLLFSQKLRNYIIPALFQIITWRRPGDEPLSEQWWSVYWRMYALLGLNELILMQQYFSIFRCMIWWHVISSNPWWRLQMESFSALPPFCVGNLPVTGEIPTQRPVTRSFDVFFDLRLNKRWSTQWCGWWFETPSRMLWRHCNDKTLIK